MTCQSRDEEIIFYERCLRYAKARFFEHAEDFASEAWIMRKKWPGMLLRHAWANYWRGVLGVRGFAKNRMEQALHYRKALFGEDGEYVVETRIAAPTKETRLATSYLNATEQLIRIALEEGFNLVELSTIFNRSSFEIDRLLEGLRLKVLENEGLSLAQNRAAIKAIKSQDRRKMLEKKRSNPRQNLSLEQVENLFGF